MYVTLTSEHLLLTLRSTAYDMQFGAIGALIA